MHAGGHMMAMGKTGLLGHSLGNYGASGGGPILIQSTFCKIIIQEQKYCHATLCMLHVLQIILINNKTSKCKMNIY